MSTSATVIFRFDGSKERFAEIYTLVCAAVRDLALDIGTYFQEGSGAIEFIIDDFTAFEAKIAQTSSQTGIVMRAVNYLHSEEKPNQPPQPTPGTGSVSNFKSPARRG